MFRYYLNDYPLIFPDAQNDALNDGPGFEDLLALAAQDFPPNDGKFMDGMNSYAASAPSPFASSSGSSSALSPCPRDCDQESDSDSDSDIEPLCLDNACHSSDQQSRAQSLPTPEDEAPFLPHKRGIATDTGAPSGTNVPAGLIKRKARVRQSASHPPPTIVHSSHRNIYDRPNPMSTVDPSYDADSYSDGNATDDEYVPSPALGASKRRRAPSTAITTGLPVSCKPFTASQTRPTKRARVPPPSRNKQASSPAAIEQAAASKKPTFICPECGWHQTNQRMPDFRRHLLTHTRSIETDTDKGWWCKGVLVKDAGRHGIPKTAAQYLFQNDWRVGGCLRTFSRRDALKRHLDNPNVSCIGRPCELSQGGS